MIIVVLKQVCGVLLACLLAAELLITGPKLTVISRPHLCPDEVDLIITCPDFDIRNSVIHSLQVVIPGAF